MRDYLIDGRIPIGWRIDIPGRRVELWEPTDTQEPVAVLYGADAFALAGMTFTVDEIFKTVLNR